MVFQKQSTSLRPLTTAHLAQTMTLLELTGAELYQKIESELASNPALEVIDIPRCPTCNRPNTHPGQCLICKNPNNLLAEQPIIFISPYTDHSPILRGERSEDSSPENYSRQTEELPVYVLKQIAAELASEDRPIAAHILTSLDDDGLLRIPIIEIARYHHTTLGRVGKVIKLIQHCDPIGVGSGSPQEALLVQLELLAETRAVNPLARRAILEGIDFLSRRAYNELGRLLGITAIDAQRLASFIAENLNPYPGRAHWGDVHQIEETKNMFLTPDIIISLLHHQENPALVVEILTPFAGSLRVNPLFREALTQAPTEQTDNWQAHLEQASLLVKCLQQRNHTMVRLMDQIVRIQRNFILEGDSSLVPITRAQLAQELEVHESTVSRAVSGKAVQLPNNRIIPLAKFFDRSLQVRTAMRELIAEETSPLSDTDIADKLNNLGYPIARRTVAKYRAMEGILPARIRQTGCISP